MSALQSLPAGPDAARGMAGWRSIVGVVAVVTLAMSAAACSDDSGQNEQSADWQSPPSGWDAPSGESGAGCDTTALPGDYDAETSPKAIAVSASGEYILGEIPVPGHSGKSRPILWRDGEYHMLDAGEKHLRVRDVNSDGVVVGELLDEETWPEMKPFMYFNGQLTELDAVYQPDDARGGVHEFFVAGITDAGDLIGNVTTVEETSQVPETHVNVAGYHWDTNDPEAEKSELDGVVAAMSGTGDLIGITDEDVWKWNAHGEGEKLPKLEDTHETLFNVDPEGADLAGDWLLEGPASKVDISQGDDPAQNGVEQGNAIDVNGDVYGSHSQDDDSPSYAAVVRDGEVTRLPGLSGVDGSHVSAVSEDGAVLAGAATNDGDRYPVVWNCG